MRATQRTLVYGRENRKTESRCTRKPAIRVLADLYGARTNEKRLTLYLTIVERPFIRLLVLEKITGPMERTKVWLTMALKMDKKERRSK